MFRVFMDLDNFLIKMSKTQMSNFDSFLFFKQNTLYESLNF